MEKRRQEIGAQYLRPLGRSAMSGLGENLGSTDFKSKNPTVGSVRPKLVPNRTRPKRAVTPPSPAASDDPIDFLSSQASARSGSSARVTPSSSNKPGPVPQPPPFSKAKSVGVAPRPKLSSKPAPPSGPVRYRNPPNGSDDSNDSSSSHPAAPSTASASSLPPRSSRSSAESEDVQVKPARRVVPAPAPFASLVRPRPATEEPPKPTSSAPKPAPPPFKGVSTTLPKPKRTASASPFDQRGLSNVQPPATTDPVATPASLKDMPRIPRKGQVSALVPGKEPPPPPKRVPAEFPMAAYAREAAAKMAAMEVDPPSPRNRFRPEDIERLLQSSTNLDDSLNVGDDTLLHVDPEDLCPFCDELLPDNPSPYLLQTMAELRLLAKPEPRPRNPLGLTAPLTTFINLCHMHRAESTHVQRGKENHWPVVIDWNSVRKRLSSIQIVDALREIISNPESSEFFVTLSRAIKRDGALKAASIKAQLDSFELSHPGYYGEQGTVVFFEVLIELFPELSPEECKPLQPREFFLSVLVPEAAALLVEQDMNCTRKEALVILRESRQYGQMMFPDRGDPLGWGESGHMDEAGAKQLQWRKDMIQTATKPSSVTVSGSSDDPIKVKPPSKGTLEDDVLVLC
ncbi:hypothetical protein FRC06_004216 [Ceratobasidium sp. 370]|nr:hypothetical protein FRC06_004216 [Ceratobasidium sp. 370]